MKNRPIYIIFILILVLFLVNCTTSSLNTSKFRDSNMESGNISFSQGGLTKDQIDTILSTKFPPGKPVSMSLFYLNRNEYGLISDYDPIPVIVNKINNTQFISRIVPVPPIFISTKISIDTIQQIGIRSLCEYSLILYGDMRKAFFSYKSPFGHYMISSTLDFVIIDNRTTAIIASDKLFTEFQAPVELFTDKSYQETMQKMYEEQAKVLNDKLNSLFSSKR